MQSLVQFSVFSMITLIFAALAHWKIGRYPPALPKIKTDGLEFLEAMIIWGILFASVTYLMLSTYVMNVFYPFIILGSRLLPVLHLFLMFEVPLFFEVVINRRSRSDLGFAFPKTWTPAVALVGFGALSGIVTYIFESPAPYPMDYLIVGMLTPALSEEWAYRSVIQQKLERAHGQTNAWLLSGLLYGLMHVPTDFFGTLWIASGQDLSIAFLRFVSQCASGWLWGVLFIKSRSIYPVMISHYLFNYLGGALAHIRIPWL